MKFTHFLAIAGLAAAGTAAAGGGGGNSSILFRFDHGTGNQVFRSAAGVPTLNTVAGVPPGGAPWGITALDATIRTNGDIRARGEGVVLLGGDGTRHPRGPAPGDPLAVLPQRAGAAGGVGSADPHAVQLRARRPG